MREASQHPHRVMPRAPVAGMRRRITIVVRANGASPQPDESCHGRQGGRAPVGAETVTGTPVRCMNRSERLVGLLAARLTGAQL